jgi:putative tricarboxylic transport membrane protein
MDEIASSIGHLFTFWPICLILIGTILGVTVGATPGLTGAMLIALTLPLTYRLDYADAGIDAMILLVSMYVGSISGGLISATLLRMPGTPASIMTTLDGYPMARDGRPGRALGLGITASFVGGMVSWLFLILLAKPMADISTKLGPFDFFALVLMALVLIASVSSGSLAKGIFSGMLGMLVTIPGESRATSELRWTFGISELSAGFSLLPVLVGLFAVSQLLSDVLHIDERLERVPLSRKGMLMSLRDWKKQAVNMGRSSLIGTWIGILPGIGANIGSVLAYAAARSTSKKPEEFGKGSEEGIVASETANNATVGGALIPLISLGIPGSVIDAILLGALIVHGLQPGPLLFKDHPEVAYTMMGTVFLANIVMFVFMVLAVRLLSKLMYVPKASLLPVILVFCIVGSFALNNRWFDVGVMLSFGLVGFAMERMKIPLAPFVIGFVLAPIAEEKLCAGLMASNGSYLPIFMPNRASLYLVIVAFVLLLWPLARRRLAARKSSRLVDSKPTD